MGGDHPGRRRVQLMDTAPALPMRGNTCATSDRGKAKNREVFQLKKFFGSRPGMAILFILASAACTILLAGPISLINGEFILVCKVVFFFFFAGLVVSAVLLVLTNIPEEWTIGFGYGLYYGTILVSAITRKVGWVIPDTDRILLGAVISSLVCYAVYQDMIRKKGKR